MIHQLHRCLEPILIRFSRNKDVTKSFPLPGGGGGKLTFDVPLGPVVLRSVTPNPQD